MNFYEAQAGARRNTSWLVVLFGLAVAGLVLAAVLLILIVISMLRAKRGMEPLSAWSLGTDLVFPVTLGVLLLVGLGSLLKMRQLSAGGRVVAESLGGQLIPRSSGDPVHRRVLNVVEEMALAAGMPVPSVYILDEEGINAFAAGWTSRDAVIGLTHGAAHRLNREELQGVIAHEFSHIGGGDMARNLKLAGTLHGILLLGIIGGYLMHAMRFSSGSRNRNGSAAALGILAVGLFIIGYVGTFFGNMIKAIISRQREFLADASAVQFTRNPRGITDALKKIGGNAAGSLLRSPAAADFSHSYFANGLKSSIAGLLATHPPLDERIRRLEPGWDGRWLIPKPHEEPGLSGAAAGKSVTGVGGSGHRQAAAIGLAAALDAVTSSGRIDERSLGYARDMLERVPPVLLKESTDPHGAQALLLAMVLDEDSGKRDQQLAQLEDRLDAAMRRRLEHLELHMLTLGPELRLPLIDLAMPALRELSTPQYKEFRLLLLTLMQADNQIVLKEWILKRVLLHHLDGAHGLRHRPVGGNGELAAARGSVRLLMSTLAWIEHESDQEAGLAFDAGCRSAGLGGLQILPRRDPATPRLDEALDELSALKPAARQALLQGLTACIALDGRLTVDGLEMLRAVAGSLEMPMPSFVAVED